jgi:hypothetical protein
MTGEDWDALHEAAKKWADEAPPLNAEQRDAIANAFRGLRATSEMPKRRKP